MNDNFGIGRDVQPAEPEDERPAPRWSDFDDEAECAWIYGWLPCAQKAPHEL